MSSDSEYAPKKRRGFLGYLRDAIYGRKENPYKTKTTSSASYSTPTSYGKPIRDDHYKLGPFREPQYGRPPPIDTSMPPRVDQAPYFVAPKLPLGKLPEQKPWEAERDVYEKDMKELADAERAKAERTTDSATEELVGDLEQDLAEYVLGDQEAVIEQASEQISTASEIVEPSPLGSEKIVVPIMVQPEQPVDYFIDYVDIPEWSVEWTSTEEKLEPAEATDWEDLFDEEPDFGEELKEDIEPKEDLDHDAETGGW